MEIKLQKFKICKLAWGILLERYWGFTLCPIQIPFHCPYHYWSLPSMFASSSWLVCSHRAQILPVEDMWYWPFFSISVAIVMFCNLYFLYQYIFRAWFMCVYMNYIYEYELYYVIYNYIWPVYIWHMWRI